MIRRLANSRGMRKLRRDRMAMASLSVILAYLGVALLVGLAGVLPVQKTKERVLPNLYPGWLEKPRLEKRLEFAAWYLDRVEGAINRAERRGGDVREELERQSLAERRVAEAAVEDLRAIIARGWEAYDALAESEDLAHHPRLGELVAQLEGAAAELFPTPAGWKGLVYRFRTFLGSEATGASIAVQAFYSIKIAFQVGLVAAVLSVALGSLLGAAAGFLGGWVDHAVMWVVSTISSIPHLVLLLVLVYMFDGSIFERTTSPFLKLVPLYTAFALTFWVGTCRVIRGEVMKIRELEHVQAATALGFGRGYIMLRHVLPNTAHLMFINFSLLFIGAIKSEVILSFLGLGVKGQPSWGVMIYEGKDQVGTLFFWGILSATALMFGLVLSFNILSDALQDAFDPKHV